MDKGPVFLEVTWTSVSPTTLSGAVSAIDDDHQGAGGLYISLLRGHEQMGAASLHLYENISDNEDRRVVPLSDRLTAFKGREVGINGKDCGVLQKLRITVEPGIQDETILASHVGVNKVDDLFIAAGGMSWADLIGEGQQDGKGE